MEQLSDDERAEYWDRYCCQINHEIYAYEDLTEAIDLLSKEHERLQGVYDSGCLGDFEDHYGRYYYLPYLIDEESEHFPRLIEMGIAYD